MAQRNQTIFAKDLFYRLSNSRGDTAGGWKPLATEAEIIPGTVRSPRISRGCFDPDSLFAGRIVLSGLSDLAMRELVEPHNSTTLDLMYTDSSSGAEGIIVKELSVGELTHADHIRPRGRTEAFQAFCHCRRTG